MAAEPRILADGWYSPELPGARAFEALLERMPRRFAAAVRRRGWLRGLALLACGIGADAIVMIRNDPGWRSALLGRALFGRRRTLVALHFIDHAPRSDGRGRWVDAAWRPVERWANRRALAAAQVLSSAELPVYAERFDLPRERLAMIPFAWRMSPAGAPAPEPRDGARGVAAIGRAHCDWPTVFAAAAGRGWELTVVCGAADRAEVEALAAETSGAGSAGADGAGGAVRVLCEIPHDAARALLRDAAVCVIATREAVASHGHVRLCDATDAGAAVVATRVRCLDSYLEDGRTAVQVDPGDAAALGAAVDDLLADPARRRRLSAAAFARAEGWTWDAYVAALGNLARRRA